VGDLLKILNLKSANDYQAMKKQLGNVFHILLFFVKTKSINLFANTRDLMYNNVYLINLFKI